ncbi:MAG: putative transposase [Candidatus Dormibacteria bacterium]
MFELPPLLGQLINRQLTLVRSEGQSAVFCGSTPLYRWDSEDKVAERLVIVSLAESGLAKHRHLGRAFAVHENTVARSVRRAQAGGMVALVPAKRGPKGPSKVSAEVLAEIDRGRAEGLRLVQIQQLVRESLGVEISRSYLSRVVRRAEEAAQGVLTELEVEPDKAALAQETSAPATAPKPQLGEMEAAAFEPPAVVPEVARGRYMGTALYYPALEVMGLVEVAKKCFRLPNSELFGVRAVTLTLFFLSLLSQTTVEAAKHLRRFEFGPVLGAGRAPAVKTLRRKLAELVQQDSAGLFQELLAKRWVEQAVVATAYLYVDGHMKAYSGKRKLAECWNSQRRMPLPGVLTHFVNDLQGRPLLFVTEEANVTLAKAMPRVVQEIRKVLGDRSFTVIFDRGGYEGELFTWLRQEEIDFITYQPGEPHLPRERFSRHETRFEGKKVRLWIAEDQVSIAKSGPWRRIVVRTQNGHQTPILTSLTHMPPARVALLMFARWRQENFFKYMKEHLGLDQLLGYASEEADGSRLVPNPKRHQVDRELKGKRQALAKLRAELGQAVLDEPRDSHRTAHGLKVAQKGQVKQMRQLEAEIADLLEQRSALLTHVPLSEAGSREVMRLEQKAIFDRIKMTAYNAEEWLLERLASHYPNAHDIRLLLRSFAELSGEIRSTAQGVVVTLDPPDTPQHRRALQGLCADLSQLKTTFPGTDLPVTYEVAVHHSEVAA